MTVFSQEQTDRKQDMSSFRKEEAQWALHGHAKHPTPQQQYEHGKSGCRSPDELVMTAIISLQDNPEGTHVDDIVRYLEVRFYVN